MTELRFGFGSNWQAFLATVNETRIQQAEKHLLELLEENTLSGQRFLDIGSGSGLMSLAARRLGAAVDSFDYDPQSIACTRALRDKYFRDDPAWTVEQGDAIDSQYMAKYADYDIVYSWGVLHHTGAMWQGLANAAKIVRPSGKLYIAIYNDQGNASRRWTAIKRLYNKLPAPLRPALLAAAVVRIWGPPVLRDTIRFGNPLRTWREYYRSRGMSAWHDVVDWIGGYPFEVAKPEDIFRFYKERGFSLEQLRTVQGYGCNEFVFRRQA